MQKQNEVSPQPLLLNIKQAMQVLGLGKTKIYELIANEGLPVERFGKSVRFYYPALQQWIVDRRSSGDAA
jgi:excisionase family DNA binding protein